VKRTTLIQQKTEVVSNVGVVVAQSIAAEAGGQILERGGNAIDAAVATSLVACAIEPCNASLGGGGAVLVHHAASGKTYAIEFNGRLPKAMREDTFVNDLLPLGEDPHPFGWRGTRNRVSWRGYKTLGVPGQVAGLALLHQRFGKLPFSELVEPAIRICEEGWEVDRYYQYLITQYMEDLQRFESIANLLLPGGRPPTIRDFYTKPTIIQQPALANTLRTIARGGADAFYRGEIAVNTIRDVAPYGALVTVEDYAAYAPELYEDGLRTTYRGYDIVCMPGAFGGVTVVETLNILEGFDLAKSGHNTPETLHRIIEALRLAWADRFYHMGDPEFERVPLAGLATKEYAAERRALIGPRVPDSIAPGNPWPYQGERGPSPDQKPPGIPHNSQDTTHLCAMDAEGNTVSLVHTLGGAFGAMVLSPSTGIIHRNYTNLFNPEPGTRNSLGPWKRPLSHDSLTLVFKDGKPFISIGAPGGRRVIPAVVQVLINVIDFGMSMQEAIAAPRVHTEGSDPKVPTGKLDARVIADERIPVKVLQELAARGHQVTTLPPGNFASPVAIMRDPETGTMRTGVTVETATVGIAL